MKDIGLMKYLGGLGFRECKGTELGLEGKWMRLGLGNSENNHLSSSRSFVSDY
jgi:hypothetical protein